jgi:hypothetical protein
MNQQLLDRLTSLEQELSAEKGDFTFFALFVREKNPLFWDLLVSAPWLKANEKESTRFMIRQLHTHLEREDLLSLSQILIIDENDPILAEVPSSLETEHNPIEVRDREIFGELIDRGYIITARKPDVAPAYPAS